MWRRRALSFCVVLRLVSLACVWLGSHFAYISGGVYPGNNDVTSRTTASEGSRNTQLIGRGLRIGGAVHTLR